MEEYEENTPIGYDMEELTEEERADMELMADTSDVEEFVRESDWIIEAQQIPLDKCTPQEQLVLVKCINKEELTPEEQDLLQRVLQQYRPAIQEIKPAEQIENAEHNQQIVDDLNEFLELSESFEQIQPLDFTFSIGGREMTLQFDVHPLLDSTAVLDLNKLALFKDLTQDELLIFGKGQRGETLTREERIIQEEVDRKLANITEENKKAIITEFLAMTLTFRDKQNTYEEMIQVFQKLPLAILTVLFYRVQQMTGVTDARTEVVFPETS